jgi:hypothetical protein
LDFFDDHVIWQAERHHVDHVLICHPLAQLLTYTGAANKKEAQNPLRKTLPMHSAAPSPCQYILIWRLWFIPPAAVADSQVLEYNFVGFPSP